MEAYEPITLPELFVPPEATLVDAVNWLTPANDHWQHGIQYYATCTEVSVTMSPCVSGAPESFTKSETFDRITRGARAFTIYAESDCSAGGSDWYEQGEQEVLSALAQSGPTQMERTLWSGQSGMAPALVYPNLSSTGPVTDSSGRILLQPAATTISGVPLDIVEALGRLEQALRDCYDGRGVIHAPIALAEALCARALVYREGGKLYTWVGNRVVIGGGYSTAIGSGGGAPPGGSAWMWATSPIFGIRARPRAFAAKESLNRADNTIKFIAEQTVLLGWECCRVGVLVTTGGEQAGEPTTPLQDT